MAAREVHDFFGSALKVGDKVVFVESTGNLEFTKGTVTEIFKSRRPFPMPGLVRVSVPFCDIDHIVDIKRVIKYGEIQDA